MRERSPLHTYGRRSERLFVRRSASRRAIGVSVVATLVLAAAGVSAWMLLDAPSGPSATSQARRATSGSGSVPASGAPAQTAESTPPAAAPATSEPSGPPTITVAGVGDMLFDRQVKALIEAEGGEAPLSRVAERLSLADVTVGNLETTLADGGKRNPVKEPKYAFRGHPAGVEGLRLAGFDAVSLANNHMLDYGWDPLRDTIATLVSEGIGHAGSGANTEEAWRPATIETSSGASVAYLAFTHVVPAGFLASEDRPGVASGKMDMKLVTRAVKRAKKTHDYVIVSFHWGIEYEDDANADQVKKARQTIDAGADMVLAHHPHVIQGVEFYKDRLIAYSLGDFVFDHYSRKTGEAFILEAELGPNGTPKASAVPVYLDEYGRPEFVKGAHAREILQRLKKISAKHGTTVERDGHIGRMNP